MNADLEQHLTTRTGASVYGIAPDDDQTEAVDHDLYLIDAMIGDARERIATRDTRHVMPLAVELAKRHRLPDDLVTELAAGLLQVELQAMKAGRERLLNGAVAPIIPEEAQPISSAAATVSTGPLFSEVLPKFIERMTNGKGGWKPHTLMQNNGTFRCFVDLCGDRPVTAYGLADFSQFSDVMRRLPRNYAKGPEWAGKTLREIGDAAKGNDVARLTEKTVKRHLVTLSGLFEYLKKSGVRTGDNPARGHTLPNKDRADGKRDRWEGDELRKLFESPLFTGNQGHTSRDIPGPYLLKDAKYWLPIMGLYHGNRLEEFAQLVRSDVRKDGGILYFAINDEGTKQVKNEHSKRRVPMHPEMLRLGFMDYLKAAAPNPGDPVFPELVPRGEDLKRGVSFSKWFGKYRKKIGLGRRGLDYHSFRHTFTTKLAKAGVSLPVIDALTGHAGQGISASVYTKELSLSVLNDAIAKVEYAEVRLGAEPKAR